MGNKDRVFNKKSQLCGYALKGLGVQVVGSNTWVGAFPVPLVALDVVIVVTKMRDFPKLKEKRKRSTNLLMVIQIPML